MKYAILHLLLLLSSFNTLLAQLTPPHFYHVPPQSGVVNSYFMFPASLFIFTQAEIAGMVGPVSGPIEIGAIWFRHGGGSDGLFTDLSNFKIRMGHTTLVNPVPVFDDNFNAGASQTVLSKAVYTYTPYLANVQDPTVGWTAINLDTPFVYNFTDNLCIEMSFSATSDFIYPNYASVDSWSATGSPLTRTAFTYGDDTASIDVPRPMFGLSGPVDGGPDGDPVCLDYLPGDDSPAIFIVPDSVQGISVKLWGGAGGGGPSGAGDAPGGGGGYAEFELAVTPGEEIAIVVGKGGQAADGQAGGLGGWPGGGNGGSGNRIEEPFGIPVQVGGAGGGGGATIIRRANEVLAVAGGGGGGAAGRGGGGGGGLDGQFNAATNMFSLFGFGGTQTAGGAPSSNQVCPHPVPGTEGSAFQGGTGATDLNDNSRLGGGGGGSGYFGGGGGGSQDACHGTGSVGGGGSGYLCTSCPGISGSLLGSDQFFGQPANPEDPLLDTYPGTATGVSGQDGGGGLVQICFNSSCPPSFATIDVASCESFADPLGTVYDTSGTYSYVLTSATGCDSVVTLNLTINPSPAGSITTTPDSCLQTTYPFSVSSDSAITSIRWDFGDPGSGAGNTSDAIAPSHAFSAPGAYNVTAIVDFSCGVDTFSSTLAIVSCDSAAKDCSLFVPNVFSPNADSVNDGFRPLSACGFEQLEFSVFGRWGQLMYQTSSPTGEWDGKHDGQDCNPGVYVYLIKYKFQSQELKTIRGTVTLLR